LPQIVPDSGIPLSQKSGRRLTRMAGRVFSFPVLLASLLVTFVFAIACKDLADPDIWWHLRNAEYLITNHRFIRFDMYSFTAFGRPWVNTEWLAEVPYYLAWRASGLVGILIVSLVLLESIFLGLFYLCWKETGNVKASALACYFAIFLGTVSFGPRTILFGYMYMVLLLVIVQRFRLRRSAPLWILPPLFCLWANTHGSWSLGLIVFAIVIAAGMIEGNWGKIAAGRWSPSKLRRLVLAFVASAAALFINPYGYRLVVYPVEMAFHQKLNISHVAEWVSVDFHDARGKVALILIAALLLGALLRSRRWELYEVGLVLFGLYCGLTYIRFLMLSSILIAPLLAKFADFIPPYRREIDKPVLNALLILGALAFMVRVSPSAPKLQQSINRSYPAEALSFLRSHPTDGPMLNYYLWGGYLGWENRSTKCFIDSRVDIFEYTGVLKDYLDLLDLKDFQVILDKYRIRYVLFPRKTCLSLVLAYDPKWRVIYRGQLSEMFERVGSIGPEGSKEGITANR
jgi:hypothetical protein